MKVDLAIVIVSYNVREMLRACLQSLPAALAGMASQTFVVDNASSDGSAAMVESEFPDVVLHANAANVGFAAANNLALKQVDARHILLLNPDTEARPGSLRALYEFLEKRSDAGACGPMLLNTDGSLQKNGSLFPTFLSEFLLQTGLWRLAPGWDDRRCRWGRTDFEQQCEVDVVMGACLVVRGTALAEVGLLDERFFMFYEETDLCMRLRRAGWKVYYVPQARVIHHWMGSVRTVYLKMAAQFLRSQVSYHRKHSSAVAVCGIYLVFAIGTIKNEIRGAGVAVKRLLRRLKLLPEVRP